MKKKPKFLLLGWDAADWKVINPLIDKGQMPALESLINKGVMGNIATLDPPLSPMLWTSIATGKYAFKHGVHGFVEASEDGSKIRAVTNQSIQTSTVWDILNKKGFQTNVVGWWPSHPAGPLNGAQVSNFHAKVPKDSTWHNWPIVPNAVYPDSLQDKMNELRVHPGELGIEQLASFIPNIELLREKDEKLVNLLLNDLAECLTVHSTSTYLAEHTEWDFMAVYYNAIDHISHIFMKYHPPKLPWVDQEDFDIYHAVIEAIYRFHDMMLGRWLELVDEDTYVMVLSDHGFHSDEMRVKALPKEPAAIAREHNYLGLVCLKGPGVKADEIIFGSSLLDVTPTILSIFDLEVGKDMDGKVLSGIFEKNKAYGVIPTWDGPKKKSLKKLSHFENDELIQQLADLGYVEQEDTKSPKAVKKLLDENNFYLARSYFEAGKLKEAKLIVEKISKDHPENLRYLFYLARINAEQKNPEDLEQTIGRLEKKVNKGDQAIQLLKGKLKYLQNDFAGALSIFKGLSSGQEAKNGHIAYQIATTLLKLNQNKEAIKYFKQNLVFNPNNANALHGIGMAYLTLGQYEEAIDKLIDAIAITYFNPSAHFHLGKAFMGNGNFTEAEQAFLVARHLAPAMSKARLELIGLYENELKDFTKAQSLKEEMKRSSRGTVYLVSGLPRSGTSMMMQMLRAGGLEVYSDNKRPPDPDNPRGYFEHQAVKRLANDSSIVYEAKGKLLKVIVSLLKFLPANMDYKVILMNRSINQVVKSQDKMLQNLNKAPKDSTAFGIDELLQKSYLDAKKLLTKSINMDFVELNYEDVIENPEKEVKKIRQFLSLDLKESEMIKQVDKSLYRNK